MIEVNQKIKVYEIDDIDTTTEKYINVNSHWNHDEFVVIKIGKKTYTVDGIDLKAAIDNAMNTKRF